MAAVLVVAGVEAKLIRRDYLLIKALLENIGTETIGPGTVSARQTIDDGSFRSVEFFNPNALAPGDKTKVRQLLGGGVKALEFKTYRQTDGESIALTGVMKRSLFPRTITDATETIVNDVLVSVQEAGVRLYEKVKVGTKAMSRAIRNKNAGTPAAAPRNDG
jgi:hypothetical protein